MRLIDAYTAISLIQEDKIEGETLDIIKALGDGLQAETLNQACDRHIKIIKSLPTIAVESTKHGHWIEWDNYDGTYKCSVCGMDWDIIEGTPQDNGMYYCPNCGADMRGE